MRTLWQDLRFALRSLAKKPGFTAVAILTLALGIGATCAMFALLDAVLLRPLPFPESGRIVVVGPEWQGGVSSLAPADFLDVQRDNRSFEVMAGIRPMSFNLSGGERPERAAGCVVTPDFFRVIGAQPAMGRALTAADRGTNAVVLSYGLWQQRLGGRANALGETLPINGEKYTIVGIMPRGFVYPEDTLLWVSARFAVPEHPLTPTVDTSAERGMHYFDTVGRLKPGVSLAAAAADVNAILRQISAKNPGADASAGALVKPLQEVLVGDTRPALVLLLSAVLLVFLVSCTNVANLLLARAATRRRELVIRRALGAGLGRLARQLVTEGVLLSVLGGALGVLAAGWMLSGLGLLVPAEIRSYVAPSIDPRVLAFTLLITAAAGILAGLAPIREAAASALVDTMKEDARAGAGHTRLRSGLVVAETAFAALLLVVGGLLLQSFSRLSGVSSGFHPENLLTMRLSLPETAYQQNDARAAFVAAVKERVNSLPGVRSATIASRLPLVPGGSSRSIVLEGRTYSPNQRSESNVPDYFTLTPDYFRTMAIPLIRGRDFNAHDDSTALPVAIVNQAMARAFWPGEEAVGKRLKVGDEKQWREVVGVAGDVHQRALDAPAAPALFLPFAQDPWSFFSIVVRTAASPAALAPTVEAAVHAVDPNEPVYDVRTYEQILGASVSTRKFQVLLVAAFAALGMLLAAIGLYGVIAYSVAQRTRELGVRLALGAQRGHILGLVLGQGARLAVIGLVLGSLAAAGLGGALRSLLFATSPLDPLTFLGVALVLGAVSLVACYIPARRAMRVDPLVALRYE